MGCSSVGRANRQSPATTRALGDDFLIAVDPQLAQRTCLVAGSDQAQK